MKMRVSATFVSTHSEMSHRFAVEQEHFDFVVRRELLAVLSAAIGGSVDGLEGSSVDRGNLERFEIKIFKAADVDGFDLVATAVLTCRKRRDAACFAERMVDDLLVEMIVGERIFARNQLELIGRNKRQNRSLAVAHGAIAFDRVRQIRCHLEFHVSAMTAAGICLHAHGPFEGC